jgi:hypothetical protein
MDIKQEKLKELIIAYGNAMYDLGECRTTAGNEKEKMGRAYAALHVYLGWREIEIKKDAAERENVARLFAPSSTKIKDLLNASRPAKSAG